MRSFALRLALVGGVVVVCASLAEIGARALGQRPWQVDPADIQIEPGGSLFESDPKLGYRHRPGRYRVTEGGFLRFDVTHGSDSLRITHPETEGAAPPRPQLWIFGGSCTHGWSVSDAEAYPWKIQERFPRLEVVNFGVNGYGTLHSLIQFEEALESRPKPMVVVIAYASFHEDRNTFARARRKLVAPWNHLGPLEQPRARLDGEGGFRWEMSETVYAELPGMRRSALLHLLEKSWNQVERRILRSREVTLTILERFAEIGRQQGTALVIAGIIGDDATTRILDLARERGFYVADISVDLDEPRYNNLPWDPHPSEQAHRHYAEKLGRFLVREVLPPALALDRPFD